MPSLNQYKKLLGSYTDGQARKLQSDMLMEATWDEDLQSCKAYIYDYYHDDEPLLYVGMHPEQSKTKFPIDIKYIINSYNAESKDIQGKHIQFKPSFNWKEHHELDYYHEMFERNLRAEYPIGLYLDVYDNTIHQYRKWLVTEIANALDMQFPTWYILPCDQLFQWIYDNKRYQICGVGRSQNSYNSGLWQNRGGAIQLTMVENQRICVLPMNDITGTLFYDQRVAISVPLKEPICWKLSKVETAAPRGVTRLTFAQDRWNEHTDAFHYDDGEFSPIYYPDRNVIGMYADYYESGITPVEPVTPDNLPKIYGEITYSALPQVKIGGSYKKFTITFYDDGTEIPLPSGHWEFEIDGTDATDLLSTIEDGNTIKVKFNGDDSWTGAILKLTYITDTNIKTTIDVEVVGL